MNVSTAYYCHLLSLSVWSAATACFAKPKPWGHSDLEATLGIRKDPEQSDSAWFGRSLKHEVSAFYMGHQT